MINQLLSVCFELPAADKAQNQDRYSPGAAYIAVCDKSKKGGTGRCRLV
jgi:hypothetical protein